MGEGRESWKRMTCHGDLDVATVEVKGIGSHFEFQFPYN